MATKKSKAGTEVDPIRLPIGFLAPDPENPREITLEGFAGLGFSMETFGDLSGIVFNLRTGQLVGAHQRIAGLREAGAVEVFRVGDEGYVVHPRTLERFHVRFVDWDPTKQRMANLVANNPKISGAFTDKALGQLKALEDEAGFDDLELGALEDELQVEFGEEGATPGKGGKCGDDSIPDDKEPVTKRGDVWILGRHRIMCGDSTSPDDVRRWRAGELVTLIHADPPYGMGKEADGVEGDNVYDEKLDAFQMSWWKAWAPATASNASAYVWGNAPDLWRLWWSGGMSKIPGLMVRNEIVWDKGNAFGMKSADAHCYAPATERCLFLMLGQQFLGNQNKDDYWEGYEPLRLWLESERDRVGWTNAEVNRITGTRMAGHWFTKSQFAPITREMYEKLTAAANGSAFVEPYADLFSRLFPGLKSKGTEHRHELSEKLRETRTFFDATHEAMTDVWNFSRVLGEERFGHATPKPVAMVVRALLSSSRKDDAIAAPFSGTGPEIIAAEKVDRRCYAMEKKPAYVDICVARWEAFTGGKAYREAR